MHKKCVIFIEKLQKSHSAGVSAPRPSLPPAAGAKLCPQTPNGFGGDPRKLPIEKFWLRHWFT